MKKVYAGLTGVILAAIGFVATAVTTGGFPSFPTFQQVSLPYAGTTNNYPNILSAFGGSPGIEQAVGPGTTTQSGSSTCRTFRSVGNFYRATVSLLNNGDWQYCTGVATSILSLQGTSQTANTSPIRIAFQNGAAMSAGDGLGFGVSAVGSTQCANKSVLMPGTSAPCSWIDSDAEGLSSYPLCISFNHVFCNIFLSSSGTNIGGTGSQNSNTTVGSNNASAVTNIVGGSTANTQVNGNPIVGEVSGSFTLTVTSGCTTTPNTTINYIVHNSIVHLLNPSAFRCTSNTTGGVTYSGLPAALRPVTNAHATPLLIMDNSITTMGIFEPAPGGTAQIIRADGAAFSNANLKGIEAGDVEYSLQ